jgi:hypothetical protein
MFSPKSKFPCWLLTLSLLKAASSHAADFEQNDNTAAPASDSKTSLNQLRRAAQNPLTPIYSVPLKYVYHGGANSGGVSVGTLQPILPIALGGSGWNVINLFSLNFIGTPGSVTGIAELPNPYIKHAEIGAKGAAGLADLNLTSLISPVSRGELSWGAGVSITMPSDAPSRELGSGKFSLGPAAALVWQHQDWTTGLQISQIWSAFGSSGRLDISQMLLKPMINYNLADGWYLSSNAVIVANWHETNGQQWTVPVGGGVGKLFVLGDYKINTRLEGYYNVDRPDQAPDWSISSTVQLLFPQ